MTRRPNSGKGPRTPSGDGDALIELPLTAIDTWQYPSRGHGKHARLCGLHRAQAGGPRPPSHRRHFCPEKATMDKLA